MSNAKTSKTRKPRKATFKTEVVKGVRAFVPVNKRAKQFATVIGTKTLNTTNLKGIKKAGFRVYEYKGDKLVAIKV